MRFREKLTMDTISFIRKLSCERTEHRRTEIQFIVEQSFIQLIKVFERTEHITIEPYRRKRELHVT